MAIGRISGPLLKANLLREGVNLAFENDLLYLDVNNSRIGIKTDTPQYELDVNGTTRVPGIEVSTIANIADITISGNTIQTAQPTLVLGTADNVIYQNRLTIDSLDLENNVISSNTTNANIEFAPNGTGSVEIFGNTNVYGNIVATGSITADGNITIGDADTDNVTFNAEIASNIIPDINNTYSLGSDPTAGGKEWAEVWTQDLYAGTVTASSITVDGIDLALRQGNIWYVAENGDDTYSGNHPNDPYATIKHAVENATAGDTVHIYPGLYQEEFPLTVPVGVTVKGHSIRGVNITPTSDTRYNDAFLLNGESSVEDLTVKDFFSGGNYFTVTASAAGSTTFNVGTAPYAHTYVTGGIITIETVDYAITGATYNHTTGFVVVTHAGPAATLASNIFLSNLTFSCNGGTRVFPDNGYAFRFATDFEVSSRSPYIRNISVITRGSITSELDPLGFDAGDAGKGAYVDGAYATANSREASMLFHSVTFITPGVDALSITNGARVEWLNSFTYYANRGLYAFDSADGLKGTGKTAIRVTNLTGTIVAGNTFEYYDTDGTTLLASGTIASVDVDNKFYVNGNLTGLVTAADRGGKTVTSYNNASLEVNVKKFGTSSLYLDGVDDYAGIAANNDFGFGTGNWTVEGFFYPTTAGTSRVLFDFRASAATDNAVFIGINIANKPYFLVNGVAEIVAGTSVSLNTWNHIAVSKHNGTTRLFLNGVVQGTFVDSVDYGTAKPLIIGNTYALTAPFAGYTDEIRVSNGIARYTSAFVVPLSEFTSDTNTVLLLHLNGDDSSNVIEDDTLNSQDLRFSNGASAKYVTLADTTDFGGELRSIASACVYGNYGAYGDGNGVLMYLISQNFAYIGVGKDDSNDDVAVIQDNEVVELNSARIRYSSVDHTGDFRVGDLFYVNQADGTVNFTTSEFNIDTTGGITITTAGSTTTITGERIDTGNLRIADNTISSLSGDINLDADSGTVRVTSTGALVLPKGTTAERPGTPELGMIRYNTDTSFFEGYDGNWTVLNGIYDLDLNTYVTTELTPGANDNTIRFYISDVETATIDSVKLTIPRIEVDDIVIDGNVIETQTTNTDLILSANGTGSVMIDEIAFKDSSITNKTSGGVLKFEQTGSGYVKIAGTGGFVVPLGTSVQRPTPAYREIGMTRYNTEQKYLEIWDGISWVSVAGSSGAISFGAAENLAIEYVLVLG